MVLTIIIMSIALSVSWFIIFGFVCTFLKSDAILEIDETDPEDVKLSISGLDIDKFKSYYVLKVKRKR